MSLCSCLHSVGLPALCLAGCKPESVVVLGYFNAGEGSAPLEALLIGGSETLVDSFRVHCPDEELVGTFHDFTGDK